MIKFNANDGAVDWWSTDADTQAADENSDITVTNDGAGTYTAARLLDTQDPNQDLVLTCDGQPIAGMWEATDPDNSVSASGTFTLTLASGSCDVTLVDSTAVPLPDEEEESTPSQEEQN